MRQSRQYDLLSRLQQVSATTNGTLGMAGALAYAYNQANQRTRATLADGAYWVDRYDSLGQVTSGKKYWSDGTPGSLRERWDTFSMCMRSLVDQQMYVGLTRDLRTRFVAYQAGALPATRRHHGQTWFLVIV